MDAGVDGGGCDGGASVPRLDASALRLYESASVHATLATSQHYYMAYDDQVWSWDCAQMSLDGAPAPSKLPTGSHTFTASFHRCYVDLLVGTWLDGTASSAYTATDLDDLTAQVSVNSMRGKLVALRSDLFDVTADGSGTWRRVRTGTPWTTSWAETTTYSPTTGSTLTNNSTTNVATFGGGSYTRSWGPPPAGGVAVHEAFDGLAVAVSGTSYSLNGTMDTVYWNSGTRSYTGEIRITSNGTLVARIHGDASGALRTDVLGPLPSF
ncbi:MAG TPA: hypothetical protein VLT82_16060 [Myxococcaceae bacterium]|nr:hypothetical protein [Myxococcaceae bacterium]